MSEVNTQVYQLSMVAVGGKFRGMRGATYKLAHQYHGYSLIDGPDGVRYGDCAETSSNIYMDLYFLDYTELTDLKQSICDLHNRLPDLVKRSGLEHNPTMESHTQTVLLDPCEALKAVTYVEFQKTTPPGSIDYDMALQDLGSFATISEPATKKTRSSSSRVSSSTPRSSARLSSRSSGKLNPVSDTSPLYRWQTFEDTVKVPNPYECHIYPKSKGGSSGLHNLVAASWSFHQLFDGLKLQFPPDVPGLVVEFVSADGTSVEASDGVRHKVNVVIRFFDDEHNVRLKETFVDQLKSGSTVNEDGSIQSFVHVLDVNAFEMSLGLKQTLTRYMWKEYREGKIRS